jgi:hypothetical protein
MSTENTKLIETLLKGIIADRDSVQIAALKEAVSETIKKEMLEIKETQNQELFQLSVQLNKINIAINDLALAQKTSVSKASKAPASRQAAAAGKTEGAAAAAGSPAANASASDVIGSKLNIMQYAKQELVKNVELLKEYEKKIDEKSPGETDRIKNLEVVTKKKDDTERTKAYAFEIYKYVKEKNEDIMKDLRSRHEKWKGEQQKEDHPAKLEEGTSGTE